MSVNWRYWVTCDRCGAELDTPSAESEGEAVDEAQDTGWKWTTFRLVAPTNRPPTPRWTATES